MAFPGILKVPKHCYFKWNKPVFNQLFYFCVGSYKKEQKRKIGLPWVRNSLTNIQKRCHRERKNYKGITVLTVVGKINESILENRLRKIIEPQLEESQSGFRKGKGIKDYIFSLKLIIEKILKQNAAAYFAFLSLEQEFDRVPRKEVCRSLESRGVGR